VFRCALCKGTFGAAVVWAHAGRRLVPEEDWEASDNDPRLGETVAGRFVINRRLGHGGMGHIYVAEQLPVGRLVALKVLRPEFSRDAKIVKRFEREAMAVSRLSHPNVVMLLDFGQAEDGSCFLAMSYAEGRSLRAFIRDHTAGMPMDLAVDIAAQTARGVAAAHRAGIFHRDLKPENIQITQAAGQDHLVKVLDFGVARFHTGKTLTKLTEVGSIIGTPQYMSPEQCAGKDVDGRSDIYSLGIILFEMLSGDRPFEGTSWNVVMKQLKQPPPDLARVRPDIPELLVEVVGCCLEKKPDDRYSTVDVLLKDLERVLGVEQEERSAGARDTLETPLVQATEPDRPPTPQPEPEPEPPEEVSGDNVGFLPTAAPGVRDTEPDGLPKAADPEVDRDTTPSPRLEAPASGPRPTPLAQPEAWPRIGPNSETRIDAARAEEFQQQLALRRRRVMVISAVAALVVGGLVVLAVSLLQSS